MQSYLEPQLGELCNLKIWNMIIGWLTKHVDSSDYPGRHVCDVN